MEDITTIELMVPCDDQKAITEVQKKINQWRSTGYIVKYRVIGSATTFLYDICRYKKEA